MAWGTDRAIRFAMQYAKCLITLFFTSRRLSLTLVWLVVGVLLLLLLLQKTFFNLAWTFSIFLKYSCSFQYILEISLLLKLFEDIQNFLSFWIFLRFSKISQVFELLWRYFKFFWVFQLFFKKIKISVLFKIFRKIFFY